MKNKILSLPNGRDVVGQGLFQGKSLYEHFNYEWAGVDELTGNSLYYINPSSPEWYEYNSEGKFVFNQDLYDKTIAEAKSTGHYFEDENGVAYTDRTTYAKRKLMGTALPTVYGSFGTTLSWKGINFGLLFTYSLGGKTYNGNYANLMSLNAQSPGALHKDILNAWNGAPEGTVEREKVNGIYHINSGDVNANGVPAVDTTLDQYNNASSSRWLVSNNYLALKNLNVSYDFPKKWVNALSMQGLNLGFSVDNLFIITRQKGLNPQYSSAGGQGAYYVPARVFSFQLTAKF